jgi:hypothetical protein
MSIGVSDSARGSMIINSKAYSLQTNIFSFHKKWLKIEKGPETSVILWQNLSVGKVSRYVRTLIVAIITIVMLILSIVGIVTSQYYQNEASKKFDISGCDAIGSSVTMESAYQDYLKVQDL